ncbi:L,D-transpeptidase [Corynebacterium gerontici]|uniref:L,D-transpeptidase LppS n=1 Tax=Corynebacterium gerontici TaxID=2079234 RepID=A0A3G6J4W2_9CORY|nr:Ig-like domain-containing protein [Corynebacterium gerontici]AZA11978.1 Putative L,D-transpeptidase LppS precursor [Corynebacterium gerontici]
MLLASCTIGGGGSSDGQEQQAEEKNPPAVNVKDDADSVSPIKPVEVESKGDGLDEVTMTNEEGNEVDGKMADDGKSWTNDEVLGYGRTYTIVAKDKNGETTKSSFTTLAPDYTAYGALSPAENAEVGVGQTIAVRFPYAIEDRKAAQDAVKVKTEPAVEGAWYWLSPYEMRWRPENYWEPGTKVKVNADLYGKDLGGGVYGEADNSTEFTIGDRVEAVADDNTKTMTVYNNGEVVKSMPISMGSNQWPTPNGVYIIGDKNPSMIMDSETYGLSHENGGYRLTVNYATQMSYSGIYVHAAPWSVWAQGSQNTSHGCINVTTEYAKWFQDYVKRGDIVTVKNTIGGVLDGADGLGDWNIDWETWKKGNADQN